MQLIKQKNYLELATTDEQKNMISVIFSKKIADYQKNELGEIVELIGKWRYLVGIQNNIEPIELVALTEFIQKNYGHFTVNEINYAINLSLKGILNCDNKPYGNFSALYISTILNAFQEYKLKIIKEIRQIEDEKYEKQLLEQKSVPPPPEKRAEDMREILKNVYLRFKEDNLFADPFFLIYNFFKKKGVFQNFDKETIHKIKNQARKYAQQNKYEQKNSQKIDFGVNKTEEDIYISKGKHIFCEYFLSSFQNLDEFQQKFIKIITEKDFL
jgi:hypothetical protein